MLEAGEIDAATFASSSTVRHLVSRLGSAEPLAKTKIVAIGPVTAETCEKLGLTVVAMPKEYTIDGLVQTTVEAL